MLSFFPRGVLDEILNLIESVSEDFPSYSSISPTIQWDSPHEVLSHAYNKVACTNHALVHSADYILFQSF